MVAGEASGDGHAAELAAELRARHPELHIFGCGGEKMAAAGCELLVDARELSVMGLAEVVRHLPRLRRHWNVLKMAMLKRRPAGVVLVDFPDFNLRLAREAGRHEIPVAYFISPQVWAWRSGRVRQIRRDVTTMICIFPFEKAYYAQNGIAVAAVGHPLVERIERLRPTLPPRESRLVALMPGSREREVRLHLPVMLEAAMDMNRRHGCRFVLPIAPAIPAAAVQDQIPRGLRPFVHVVGSADHYARLAAAELAIVASGTATVEAALLDVPMIVVYRLAALSYAIGRRIVKAPHVAMVNLIAGRAVVPELIQEQMTASNIATWAGRLLEGGEGRQQMLEDLAEVRRRLGESGAIGRTADEIERVILAEPGGGGGTQRGQASRLY